jgi:cysteine desulfurase
MVSYWAMERIYLDNNATTPIATEALAAVTKAFAEGPANPSSMHWFGRRAKHQLASSREAIAAFLGAQPQDLFFTSGGTESINFLLRGLSKRMPKGKIITSNVEHSAVEITLQILESEGWTIDRLPVGLHGNVQEEQVRNAIDEETRCLFLSAVNSETGVKAPIHEIAILAEQKGIPLLVDGVAWLGKESFSLHPGVSAIAFSSHKIHGPKGVGLVVLRSPLKNIPPLVTGGFQEFNKRAGTENLEGILGFTAAIDVLQKTMPEAEFHMKKMRDCLETALIEQCGAIVNGVGPRISNTSNLCFPGVDGETLLIQLDLAGIAASHGSACSSGSLEPSRVLTNMGLPKHHVQSSIRFSTSRLTRMEDIERAIPIISRIIAQFP